VSAVALKQYRRFFLRSSIFIYYN